MVSLCIVSQLNFYVFERMDFGISLLQKVVDASHPNATFSMAIIELNTGRRPIVDSFVYRAYYNDINVGSIHRIRKVVRFIKLFPFPISDNNFNFDSTNKIIQPLCMWLNNHPLGDVSQPIFSKLNKSLSLLPFGIFLNEINKKILFIECNRLKRKK